MDRNTAENLILKTKDNRLIQRVDDTGTYTYIGKAEPSTETSAESWQIKRIDTSGNILFASGTNEFTQVWDNRASLEYS